MKKLFACLAALALCCSAFAQKTFVSNQGFEIPANEVSLSYGRVSIPSFAYTFGGIFGAAFGFGSIKPEQMYSVGAISAEYMRYVHPHVAVGGGLTYEIYNLTFSHKVGTDEGGNAIYKADKPSLNHIVSIMPAVKFPWFSYPHVSMYSKVAGGFMVIHNPGYTAEKDGKTETKDASTQVNWAMQATPIGVDFGGTNFRGFVDLGVGMQGLIIAGLRYNF